METQAEAGAADKYATADPKLAKALQAAASASPAGESGPPPEGIFPPGAANRRHPVGAPTKVDVVSDGSEPRISLSSATGDLTSWYGPVAIRLVMQMGQRVAMPTTDLALLLGPAKKEEGGASLLVADVKRAAPAKEQLGDLPPGTDKALASLETTELRVAVTPDGRAGDAQVILGKTTRPELDRLAESTGEALLLAIVPLPSKPVGVGAQWIAETRMALAGVDCISYRAYRIKSITGDRVQLTVDLKAYATTADVALAGVPKGSSMDQFDTEGSGALEVVRGEALARMADLQERVVMVFGNEGAGAGAAPAPGEAPRGAMTAQMLMQATLARGEDLRSASKR